MNSQQKKEIRNKIGWTETITTFLIMLFPVTITWILIGNVNQEWNSFSKLLVIMITGIGGLGIGMLLANEYVKMMREI